MKHHSRPYASSLNRMLTQSSKCWRLLPTWLLNPWACRAHTQKEATMATRKLFRFAAAAALLALITACGGGGGSGSTADPAPPVTAQSAVTLSLSISEQDRTVLVSTITTTDSKNAVAPVTEANAVTIDKVAYNVAGGLVKDSAGGNLLSSRPMATAGCRQQSPSPDHQRRCTPPCRW